MSDVQSNVDMNSLQFYQVRSATEEEVNKKKQKFSAAKQVLVEKLEQIKSELEQTSEPIKGDKRLELVQGLHSLHILFDRMDQASFEYFEKQEYGVVEPKDTI